MEEEKKKITRSPRFTCKIKNEYALPAEKSERFKIVCKHFEHELLEDFHFRQFPIEEQLAYAETLPDVRILTAATKEDALEEDIIALHSWVHNKAALAFVQKVECYFLDEGDAVRETIVNWDFQACKQLVMRACATALLKNSVYDAIGDIYKLDLYAVYDMRVDCIVSYVNYARTVVDALFAVLLPCVGDGTELEQIIERYLPIAFPYDKQSSVPQLSLLESMRFYKEYLRYTQHTIELHDAFEWAKETAGRWHGAFQDPVLLPLCDTEKSALSNAKRVYESVEKGDDKKIPSKMTRTMIDNIRTLLEQIEAERLAHFDTNRPITWLSLALLMCRKELLGLPRQTKRRTDGSRNGAQGYSINQYINKWSHLQDYIGVASKDDPDVSAFRYSKIHKHLLQYVTYAYVVQWRQTAVYDRLEELKHKINLSFGQAILRYDYEATVTDINTFLCEFCDLVIAAVGQFQQKIDV